MNRYAKVSLALLMTLLVMGCGGGGAEQVAEDVARRWSQDRVRDLSSEIAEAVSSELTSRTDLGVSSTIIQAVVEGLAASAIEDQIRETIEWTYSEPRNTSESRYEVIASASLTLTIPIPLVDDKEYSASVDFRLDVDTDSKRVTTAGIVLSSIRIEEDGD